MKNKHIYSPLSTFWCGERNAFIGNDKGYCRNACRLICDKGVKKNG